MRAFWPNVAGTAGSRITLIAIGVVSSVIIARVLGPEGLGTIAVMLTIGVLGVQLANLGLPSAVAYYVAKDKTKLSALFGGSVLCGLGFGSLIALGLFTLFYVIPALVPLPSTGMLAIAIVWIPFGLLSLLLLNLLLGLHRMRAYNGVQVAQGAAALGGMLLLVAANRSSVIGFYLTSLAALVGTCIVLVFVLTQEVKHAITLPSSTLIRSVTGYGFRAYLALLFSFTVLKFDLLMVARMLGEADAGYYAVAASVGDLVTLPFAAVGTVLFAAVAGAGVKRHFVQRLVVKTAAALLPLIIVAAFLVEPAVHIVFGPAYAASVRAVLWLLPGLYCLGINTILMHYFAATGMPIVTVLSPAFASVVNVLLNLTFIPKLGIIGAAIASTAAYGAMLLFSLVYLRMEHAR